MLEIERIKEKIKNLDESEAKSLLIIIYANLSITINKNGGKKSMKETVKYLFNIYNELPDKNNT